MSEKDPGGFVHPQTLYRYGEEYRIEGITLRQHYAGLAMQAIISTWYTPEHCNFIDDQGVSIRAYEVADAMIEAGKQ